MLRRFRCVQIFLKLGTDPMAYGGSNKKMNAAAELGRDPVVSTRFSLSMEMSRLTRDGTADEPVSRDQILRRERGQGNIIFPVQLTTSRIGNLTRLILALNRCVTIQMNIVQLVYYCRIVL